MRGADGTPSAHIDRALILVSFFSGVEPPRVVGDTIRCPLITKNLIKTGTVFEHFTASKGIQNRC